MRRREGRGEERRGKASQEHMERREGIWKEGDGAESKRARGANSPFKSKPGMPG